MKTKKILKLKTKKISKHKTKKISKHKTKKILKHKNKKILKHKTKHIIKNGGGDRNTENPPTRLMPRGRREESARDRTDIVNIPSKESFFDILNININSYGGEYNFESYSRCEDDRSVFNAYASSQAYLDSNINTYINRVSEQTIHDNFQQFRDGHFLTFLRRPDAVRDVEESISVGLTDCSIRSNLSRTSSST